MQKNPKYPSTKYKKKLPFLERGLITGSGVHGEGPPNHLER